MNAERPLPSPNPATAPYWKAARAHTLALPQCLECGKYHSYPRALCPFCSSPRQEWKTLSGRGSIYSYTEVFRAPSKAFAGDLPYVVAIIALEEGPHLMSRLVAPDKASINIGARVTVEFEDIDEEISLPLFRIACP